MDRLGVGLTHLTEVKVRTVPVGVVKWVWSNYGCGLPALVASSNDQTVTVITDYVLMDSSTYLYRYRQARSN